MTATFEPLERLTTVPATKVAEAASVIQGLAGSWAGSYVFGSCGIKDTNKPDAPAPLQSIQNMLGRPGMPEINFAPYAHRTNRFSSKGGSLLGHPISFQVVGPTLKNPHTNWQWYIRAPLPGTGDLLTLDIVEAVNVNPASAPGAFSRDLEDVYGLTAIPDEGLYLVIQQTGEQGSLDGSTYSGDGGVGDGFVNTTGGRAPLVAKSDASRYELFRVIALDGSTLILAPNKSLATYFTFPGGGTPVVRGVMLLKPAATRCLALPTSQNRNFVVVPPERALSADWQYPSDEWGSATFQEVGCPFVVDGSGMPVLQAGAGIPVPRPVASIVGRLLGETGDSVPTPPAPHGMAVVLDETGVTAGSWVGKIINIRDVTVLGAGQLTIDPTTGWQASLDSVMGWFEVILSIGGSVYLVQRMDEWNPVTGQSLWGNVEAFILDQTTVAPGDGIHLDITVHEPISSLWATPYFDWDAVDSARLTNLIDPKWVGRSLKDATPGTTPCHPDRAALGTLSVDRTYADPGSLYDLGFRVVLYPAKSSISGVTVPDYDRPVDSEDVILDPLVTDARQYIEVDYSNGIITLSHTPARGGALYPTDEGVFHNTDNPRGEVVIFCSCVPYSMEEGQLGGGARVTGCMEGNDHVDVYGERISAPVAAAQTIHSTYNGSLLVGPPAIRLTGLIANQIPPSGFVEILVGQVDDFGAPCFSDETVRASLWGYVGVTEDLGAGETLLHNYFGGAEDDVNDLVVTLGTTHLAVFRKQANLPAKADTGLLAVDYQYDSTYGAAKRAGDVRFVGAEVSPNLDGSVSVTVQPEADSQELFADLFSSWLLEGGDLGAPTGGGASNFSVPVNAAVVLEQGHRLVLPATSASITNSDDVYYVYYTSSGPSTMSLAIALNLPLPTPDDILLAKVVVSSSHTVATVTDLRNPLLDVDRRMDIYVGSEVPSGDWVGFKPHFADLVEAINFINEIGNPASGGGVRQFRVFVVGYMNITADYPIQIKTDGIVFESAARTKAASPFCEIRWGTARHPLIDINGRSDITFRGLSFRYNAVGGIVAADNLGAFAITDSIGGGSDVIIDNCRVNDVIDGLFTAATGTLTRFKITNNVGEKLLTSGVTVQTPALLVDPVIEGNTFKNSSATSGWAFAGIKPGIYVYSAQYGSVSHNRITGSSATAGFSDGVYVATAVGTQVDYNNITNTRGYGLYGYGTLASVSHNTLYNVFTETGVHVAPVAGDHGLLVSGFVREMVGNSVTMPNTWNPGTAPVFGSAIFLYGASGYLANNPTATLFVGGEAPSILAGNSNTLSNGTGFWVVWGSNNQILNGIFTKLHINFDEYGWFAPNPPNTWGIGANNYLGGCLFTGATSRLVLGLSTVMEGCTSEGTSGLGQGVYAAEGSILKGNDIAALKDITNWPLYLRTVGSPVTGSITVIGNTIRRLGEVAYAIGAAQVLAGCTAGDTLTVGGVVFTAVAGGAVSASQQFNDVASSGSANSTAISLALTLNDVASNNLIAAANEGANCAAQAIGDVVGIASTAPGTPANLTVTQSGPPNHFTLSGLTSGRLSWVQTENQPFNGGGTWSDNYFPSSCTLADIKSPYVLSNNRVSNLTSHIGGTITGNVVGTDLICLYPSTFAGNTVIRDLKFSTEGIATGNIVGRNMVVGADCVLTGNRVGGDIVFTTDATGCVIVGNRVTGVIGTAGQADTNSNVSINNATSVFGGACAAGPGALGNRLV